VKGHDGPQSKPGGHHQRKGLGADLTHLPHNLTSLEWRTEEVNDHPEGESADATDKADEFQQSITSLCNSAQKRLLTCFQFENLISGPGKRHF
jgi:hypothetical protein